MKNTFLESRYISWKYGVKAGLVAVSVALLSACASPGGQSTAPVAPAQPVAVTPKPVPRPPRIGLALGGGAARGFAHIGVLQVLEEQGIKPDVIVGTSAGSVVATLYASGKTPTEMANIAMSLDESSLSDWVFPGRSIMKGEAIAKLVRTHTGGKAIEAMRLPLGIVAADLQTGQAILFRKGDAAQAVRASSSVPGVFEPVKINGHEYIDGGAVSPVPVRFARQMGADIVIAVDISAIPEGQPTKGMVDILMQTFNIMGHSISQFEMLEADVVMRPKLEGVGSADFGNRRLSLLAGREAALSVLAQLKEKIAARTR
jgi:NTE family protein